jgi:hypothetical protein
MAAFTKRRNTNAGRFVAQWTLTDADATGDWIETSIGADKSVQVIFSAGSGTVTLQGSNEPGTPTTGWGLRDVTHTALSFTASGGDQILEHSLKVRPVLSGGSGATIQVYLCLVER